jgi:hypothetical protein
MMMNHENENDESSDGDSIGDWWGEGDSDEEENDNYDDNYNEEVKDETMEQFIRTFNNGDYDEKIDAKLSADRGVRMPVRATQASYNKPNNWRERNRFGLVIVKDQLQYCIDSLAPDLSGSFNLDLRHNTNTTWDQQLLMDYEEPIVWHEPILDEYWNNLDAAIDRRRQLDRVTDISGIHIENVEIKKERLAGLLSIFRNGSATNSSRCLDFNNANICGEGIVCLSKLLDVSSELKYFYLYHNRIDNMESVRCLSRSLKSHTCINTLSLAHCDLGSSPEILSVILQSDVSLINLEHNNIDSLGAVKIAEYLESNPPIRCIDLDHNRLNDEDAILISQALKRNTNLRRIDFCSNNFTSVGVQALLTCVFDGSSLNAISESNHTLVEMIIFSNQDSDNSSSYSFCSCIDELLQLGRTRKIIAALQDKVSLLKYLVNIPVELIPEVLAFPHRQVDNEFHHRYLNILYSTMRWWNMPMLYLYYHDGCVKSDTKRKRDD